MSITFALDDVVPAEAALPTRRLADAMAGVLALGGDTELPVVDHGPTHPLLGAVHLAFAQHRPLVLTPDTVWITIAQGVAQHVRLHAEALRPRLVRHADKKKLLVEWPEMTPPTDAASWASIVARFSEIIGGEIGDGPARLLQCDFSTTTDHARVASQVVLMDTYAPYFDYVAVCVCGIPRITLRGTVDDWRSIRDRIDVIAELDLGFWTASLAPIADQLVRTAAGDVDRAFWRRIYKPRDAYGGEVITGWIARLYPYLLRAGRHDRVNPLLALPLDEPRDTDGDHFGLPGVRSDDVGAGLSTAIVHVHSRGERVRVDLDGGLVGVTQDDDGALEPVCGWALRVARSSIHDIVDRLRADHAVTPRRVGPADGRALTGPADVIALYDYLDEATLFASTIPWRIRPRAEHEQIELTMLHGGHLSVTRLIDLPDGTCVASNAGQRTHYVRLATGMLGPPRPAAHGWDDPQIIAVHGPAPIRRPSTQTVEETPVVATSLADLLTWALDHGGSTDLPILGQLVDRLEPWQLMPPPPPPEPRGRKKKRGR
jgi:hypothetical protein